MDNVIWSELPFEDLPDDQAIVFRTKLPEGTWRKIDVPDVAVSVTEGAVVTPEMRSAFRANCPTGPHTVDDDTLDRGYRAMHAAAPVELVSNVEFLSRDYRRLVLEAEEMTSGVAELLATNTALHDALKARTDERDNLRAQVSTYRNELLRLHHELSQRPAVPEPAKANDWTRPREDDRRRVGGFW